MTFKCVSMGSVRSQGLSTVWLGSAWFGTLLGLATQSPYLQRSWVAFKASGPQYFEIPSTDDRLRTFLYGGKLLNDWELTQTLTRAVRYRTQKKTNVYSSTFTWTARVTVIHSRWKHRNFNSGVNFVIFGKFSPFTF